jgi:hypothetical protein
MPTPYTTKPDCARWTARWTRHARRCCAIALICGLAISVSSCSTTGTALRVDPVPPAPPLPPPPIPQTLLAPCDPLPLATDSRVPALLANHDQQMVAHHDCASRHSRLAEAAREQQVIAWRWYCLTTAAMKIDNAACQGAPQ